LRKSNGNKPGGQRGHKGETLRIVDNPQKVIIHEEKECKIYYCKHAFCNVHHLRELTFIEEECKEKWVDMMKECLLDIKGVVDKAKEDNKQSLDDATIDTFKKKYETILENGARLFCRIRGYISTIRRTECN